MERTKLSIKTTMFSTKKTIYNREASLVASAVDKYARRCSYRKMVMANLELASSGHDRAVYAHMADILLSEKFPIGVEHLLKHQNVLRLWGRLSENQKQNEIAQMSYNITQAKSDRHAEHLSRLSMDLAKKDDVPDDPELALSREVELVVLRIRKNTEAPTTSDINAEIGFEQIKSLISTDWPDFDLPTNQLLFQMFKKKWRSEARVFARICLYNLIGRRFHKLGSKIYKMTHVCAPLLEKIEFDDFVYDKSTTIGKQRKRGMKHFITESSVIENPADGIDVRAGVKRKAEKILLADERKYGPRAATCLAERKRIRATYNALNTLYGQNITSTVLCQKPSAGKPRAVYVETEDKKKYFVKGPFEKLEEISTQLMLDKEKEKYDITPMDIESVEQNGLFYLVAPVIHPYVNMSAGKQYSNEVIWQLVRVLIFRAAFNVTDTTLNNIMLWSRMDGSSIVHTVMSVDEMSILRPKPRATGVLYDLFQAVPRQAFSNQVMRVIRDRRDLFREEVRKYGSSAEYLLSYKVSTRDSPKDSAEDDANEEGASTSA